MPAHKVLCSECPKEFVTNKANKLTCSPECLKKRERRLAKTVRKERIALQRKARRKGIKREDGYKRIDLNTILQKKVEEVYCLRCDKAFPSAGKKINRICDECALINAIYAPLAEEGLYGLVGKTEW
jgi:hypothetical protein